MQHGLFAMRDAALEEAYRRAMRIGAFATAERIGFEMNEPGQEYSYSAARKGAYKDSRPKLVSGGNSSLGGPNPIGSFPRHIAPKPPCP